MQSLNNSGSCKVVAVDPTPVHTQWLCGPCETR